VAAFAERRLEYRLQYQQHQLLHEPVLHVRDPYANGKYLGVVTNAIMPGGGRFHPIPAALKKGENILLFKLVATRNAPRFKVNIVRDGSRDFDTA
jgi:hypothetical protein